MKKLYYVNPNPQPVTLDNEVHVSTCAFFPSGAHYLGEYNSCEPAVAEALRQRYKANGCIHCCKECHTQ